MATFYNQATLSYNGTVTTSNITTGEIVGALSATKTAVTETYSPNSQIVYVINIVNSSTAAYNNITITDDLGRYEFNNLELVPLTYVNDSVNYFVNGVLQNDPAVTAGPPLEISGINLPAGGVATIIYAARVNSFAPLGENGSIVNTAVISGSGFSDITVSETITAESGPNLTISKSLSPTTVTENGQLTYTFVIQNTGSTPVTADYNAVVTDTFDPILYDIGVIFNGNTWSSPANYNYVQTSGLFTTVPGQITVPAATYTQNPVTGAWIIQPGTSILTVTGRI